jgi:uncharacterized membrane protein YidH (DUF202 family)
MGSVAIGLVLVAVGAVMRFAIYAPNQHANWGTIGIILIIVGGIAFLVGLVIELPRRYRREDRYVRRSDGSAERVTKDSTTL